MNTNELVEEILHSKKYSSLSREVIERACIDAIRKFNKKKLALSEAKKQLHIIYESFLTNDCHKTARRIITDYDGDDILENRELSMALLPLHISTKERLGYLDEIYSFVSRYICSECILSDIGCGFNPLALPFFSNKPARYLAYEISQDTVDVINLYFSKSKQYDYKAELLDAINSFPPLHSDLLLAFKLLPLLQQQKKGRAMEFLSGSSFKYAIVSFPIKSLSGKNKGMEEFYSSFLEDNIPKGVCIIDRSVISNELFYVLKK